MFVMANPFPLSDPATIIARLAATSRLGPALQELRTRLGFAAPLPYNPQSLRWMREVLEALGDVDVRADSIASRRIAGILGDRAWSHPIWRALHRLEVDFPHASAPLSAYVQLRVNVRHPLPHLP